MLLLFSFTPSPWHIFSKSNVSKWICLYRSELVWAELIKRQAYNTCMVFIWLSSHSFNKGTEAQRIFLLDSFSVVPFTTRFMMTHSCKEPSFFLSLVPIEKIQHRLYCFNIVFHFTWDVLLCLFPPKKPFFVCSHVQARVHFYK